MKTLLHLATVCRPLLVAGLLCLATPGRAAHELPALPKGVTELKFSEFFMTPIGPRGLELTDKLKALDGKRVRILGYMVRQEHAVPGMFLLTPLPVQLHDHDSGLADDLPATTLHVLVPQRRDEHLPYTPQLMLLTGALALGPREEPDSRISIARLTLDPPRRNAKSLKAAMSGRGGASALIPARNFSN